MKLRNDISEKERFLRKPCIICDEDGYSRMDSFTQESYILSSNPPPLYCHYCLGNWLLNNLIDGDVGKLQIGKEYACCKI